MAAIPIMHFECDVTWQGPILYIRLIAPSWWPAALLKSHDQIHCNKHDENIQTNVHFNESILIILNKSFQAQYTELSSCSFHRPNRRRKAHHKDPWEHLCDEHLEAHWHTIETLLYKADCRWSVYFKANVFDSVRVKWNPLCWRSVHHKNMIPDFINEPAHR